MWYTKSALETAGFERLVNTTYTKVITEAGVQVKVGITLIEDPAFAADAAVVVHIPAFELDICFPANGASLADIEARARVLTTKMVEVYK